MNLNGKQKETVRRILDTAADLFSEVGFAGTRVDEIAKQAGVNKATIYYHIGDKKALYAEVLHDIFGDTAERISQNIRKDQRPEKKLKIYIRTVIHTMEHHPHIPSIMLREIASRGANLPEVVIKDLVRMFGILSDILEDGVQKGVFIKASPLIVHFMVVGPAIFCKKIEAMGAKHAILKEVQMLDKSFLENVPEEIEGLILKAIGKTAKKEIVLPEDDNGKYQKSHRKMVRKFCPRHLL